MAEIGVKANLVAGSDCDVGKSNGAEIGEYRLSIVVDKNILCAFIFTDIRWDM